MSHKQQQLKKLKLNYSRKYSVFKVKLTDVDLAMQYCGIQVHELWHYAIHDTHDTDDEKKHGVDGIWDEARYKEQISS